MDIQQFEGRKRSHLVHALDPAHQAFGLSGLDSIRLTHEALPDLDLDEVRLDALCLGSVSRTPFFIAGMTAGHPDAPRLNLRLALACEARGWAMGVGSQRRDLELSERSSLDAWKQMRKQAPKLTWFANLGISQLRSARLDSIQGLLEAMEAQALVIHANALQECMQPEGTPNFRGALEALGKLRKSLSIPVVLKETGCGFSKSTLSRLEEIGLAAVDISGLGGTHWGRIEGARARDGESSDSSARSTIHDRASQTFSEWGIPTADAVRSARATLKQTEIWASGGVRSGLDAAKLIALGAHQVGYAQPALKAALEGEKALQIWMQQQEFELRVALFCTGCQSPAQLREKEGVWKSIAP